MSCRHETTPAEDSEQNAGALTYPESAYKLRCGDYVMLNEHACRVVSIKRGKTSKHGHAKMRVTGTDLFDGKKIMAALPVSHKLHKPFLKVQELMFVDFDEHDEMAPLCLLDTETGELRHDVAVPESAAGRKLMQFIGEQRDGDSDDDKSIMVTIVEAMGNTMLRSVRRH